MIIKKNQQKIKSQIIEELVEEVTPVEDVSPDVVVEQEDDFVQLFNIDNIDFSQRRENRSGARRRGYRRIDDRNLISRAKEEAEAIKEAAYEEGYNLGLTNAKNDIISVKDSLSAFMNAKNEVFEFIAPDILEISYDIASKVVKKEIETNPSIVFSIILDVLKNISKEEPKIGIKVHPSQVQFVKDNIPERIASLGIEGKISILADPSISVGGCKFYTNNGIIDASIDTQLKIIKEVLKDI